VHDLAALDRQALAQAARLRAGTPVAAKNDKAAFDSGDSSAARPEESLRDIRRSQRLR
jgi:hypothetical protein